MTTYKYKSGFSAKRLFFSAAVPENFTLYYSTSSFKSALAFENADLNKLNNLLIKLSIKLLIKLLIKVFNIYFIINKIYKNFLS